MAEPRLQTAPRAVSVSVTVTIPGGHLSVNDLEAAVLEATRAAGRQLYLKAFAAAQEAWLAQHPHRFSAQRWRTLHWLTPLRPHPTARARGARQNLRPLPHPLEGLPPPQGHPRLVRAYGDVKDNTDSGQYLPIQHAVAWCFDHPEITRAIAQKYSRRMDLLVPALQSLGFQLEKPRGGFFLYAPAPRAATSANRNTIPFPTAEDFSQWLITEKLISTVPWDDAGAYVRFSVTYQAPTEADERAITDEILRRLSDITFHW